MAQLDQNGILEGFSKVKKWLAEWEQRELRKQNLKVVDVDEANQIIIIKGSIPGKKNTIVYLKDSIKKIIMKKPLTKFKKR